MEKVPENSGENPGNLTEISDPLGKAAYTAKVIPYGGLYTKKTAPFYGGYGGGLLGKMYSENDPNAAPRKITEEDLRSWNPLQRFAYRNHTLFFILGTLVSLGAIGITYYLSTLNVFYAVVAFFVFIVPIWYFMRTLFLIEGQSIPGAEYKVFVGVKDEVQDESVHLRDGEVVN